MRHIVDLMTWERRDNFGYFKDFLNPFICVTSEVCCGQSREKAKEQGQSYFLTYLHAILTAVNEVRELRYRVEPDGIVWYDEVDVLAPIRINKNGKFFTVRIPYHQNFETFYQNAQQIIQNIPEDGDPYDAENNDFENSCFNVILVSAIPDFYFTAITSTQKHRNGSDYPLLTVGKAVEREGRLVMPIAIAVHHGFVDGFHISDFFHRVEAYLLAM